MLSIMVCLIVQQQERLLINQPAAHTACAQPLLVHDVGLGWLGNYIKTTFNITLLHECGHYEVPEILST